MLHLLQSSADRAKTRFCDEILSVEFAWRDINPLSIIKSSERRCACRIWAGSVAGLRGGAGKIGLPLQKKEGKVVACTLFLGFLLARTVLAKSGKNRVCEIAQAHVEATVCEFSSPQLQIKFSYARHIPEPSK